MESERGEGRGGSVSGCWDLCTGAAGDDDFDRPRMMGVGRIN